MKTQFYIILSLVLLFKPLILKAQTFAGEQGVSLSCGFISGRQLFDAETVGGGFGNEETSASANIFLTYKYYVENRLALGLTAGYQTIKGGMYQYGGLENNYSLINKTIAAEMTMVYINKHNFQLYAILDFGASNAHLRSNEPQSSYSIRYTFNDVPTPLLGLRFNSQLDPFCISFGRKLSAYLELGIG